MPSNSFFRVVLLALCTGCASQHSESSPGPRSNASAEPRDFQIEGYYTEACSCSMPCPCELTGPLMGCKGIGAYQFDHGTFGGMDFSGCRLAYSLYLGQSVQLYLDAPNETKRATLEDFGRHALAGFGPVTAVHASKVEIAGTDGAYTVLVDGGKIMKCTVEPVLGGDHRTPVVHSNTFDAMNPIMYQGRCLACTYADGDMRIELAEGRNSYFNAHMRASGKL